MYYHKPFLFEEMYVDSRIVIFDFFALPVSQII
jgi:hypothetical protein